MYPVILEVVKNIAKPTKFRPAYPKMSDIAKASSVSFPSIHNRREKNLPGTMMNKKVPAMRASTSKGEGKFESCGGIIIDNFENFSE